MPSSADPGLPQPVTLGELGTLLGGEVMGDDTVPVVDVTHDSRAAGPGVLFVAVRGFNVDGHRFVASARGAGAVAVAVERPAEPDGPQLVLADTRRALGPLSAEVHGRPSERVAVVGVTGTNGKTSVAHLLGAILEAAGGTPGVVGTLGARVGNTRLDLERTTPEASDFQRLLARMVDEGATAIACEVSSHALELGRVDATRFAVAAFTNLSQDHLDFHGDMESYFRAKARLFRPGSADRAVVWTDDPWGERLAAELRIPGLSVGFGDDADVRPSVLSTGFAGSDVAIRVPGGETIALSLPLAGRFSVANAAVALGCALSLDVPGAAAVAGLEAVGPIPGRFELVSVEGQVPVVIDYSHTPAGIEAAIATARPLTDGRVVAVIGAGGNRDRSKRPLMGRAASAADLVVVTSDNPRSEPPDAIIAEVVSGVTAAHEAITDRREAISRAIGSAVPGDAVLIMGKGHEAYQEIAGVKLPFDDRQVARQVIAELENRR